MWNGIEKVLRRKAAQGVDVRLIYDDFGSLLGLPADFIVRMERAHIRCIPFNPVVPLISLDPPRQRKRCDSKQHHFPESDPGSCDAAWMPPIRWHRSRAIRSSYWPLCRSR